MILTPLNLAVLLREGPLPTRLVFDGQPFVLECAASLLLCSFLVFQVLSLRNTPVCIVVEPADYVLNVIRHLLILYKRFSLVLSDALLCLFLEKQTLDDFEVLLKGQQRFTPAHLLCLDLLLTLMGVRVIFREIDVHPYDFVVVR